MNAVAQEAFSDRMPSKLEIENADQLRTIMAGIIRDDGDTTLNLVQEKGKLESITLTPAIARTFLDVLRLISSGRGFRLIPVDAELTTQQAADLLNVSRPFLIKLLEEQKIPFTKTGRHRRVRAVDLFAYKAERDHQRSEALTDMAALDAAHGLL
jgi:excisionase family DNA binding protein